MHTILSNLLIALFSLILSQPISAITMTKILVHSPSTPRQPILIQGPMPIEADFFRQFLKNLRIENTASFIFYKGELNGYPVIVSQTGKGLENTAAATAIAIERYHPRAIINQGTSGGSDPSLNVGDIVLGKESVNSGNFKTPISVKGEGSKPLTWSPMDLMASSGSAGLTSQSEQIRYYEGSPVLLAAADSVKNSYKRGKVLKGVIGSANLWDNEIDRIQWLHQHFNMSVEDMETASAAQIADAYKVPFLGIRIVSNNLTNGGQYDSSTATDNQMFVKQVVLHYISTIYQCSLHT